MNVHCALRYINSLLTLTLSVLDQNLTNLERSPSIYSDLDRSRFVRREFLIQSGEKEHTDLSGRSGRGHLVLIRAERRRPRPLLQVNKQCGRPAAQVGVAKSRLSQMCRSRSDFQRFARLNLDLSDFE